MRTSEWSGELFRIDGRQSDVSLAVDRKLNHRLVGFEHVFYLARNSAHVHVLIVMNFRRKAGKGGVDK